MTEYILLILGMAGIFIGFVLGVMSVYSGTSWNIRNISAAALYWCAVGGIWWLWVLTRG